MRFIASAALKSRFSKHLTLINPSGRYGKEANVCCKPTLWHKPSLKFRTTSPVPVADARFQCRTAVASKWHSNHMISTHAICLNPHNILDELLIFACWRDWSQDQPSENAPCLSQVSFSGGIQLPAPMLNDHPHRKNICCLRNHFIYIQNNATKLILILCNGVTDHDNIWWYAVYMQITLVSRACSGYK